MREKNSLNKGAVTDDIHNQLRNDLRNMESKRAIRNRPSIHATLIINIMNVTVRNQIRSSDVDHRIIPLQIVRNWTLWERKFTGTMENPKTRAYRYKKIDMMSEIRTDQIDSQKIYVSMARMSSNA